jgi:hypothetical protein
MLCACAHFYAPHVAHLDFAAVSSPERPAKPCLFKLQLKLTQSNALPALG